MKEDEQRLVSDVSLFPFLHHEGEEKKNNNRTFFPFISVAMQNARRRLLSQVPSGKLFSAK